MIQKLYFDRGGPDEMVLELDKDQIFPSDPGQGTPVLISIRRKGREYTATFACALGEDEIDGHRLTTSQRDWLESKRDVVDKFLN